MCVCSRWGDSRDDLGAAALRRAGPFQVTGPAKRLRATVSRSAASGLGAAAKAGFGAVVGCGAAKEQLRRLVVTPLRHPRVFRKLGIAAVPSVLLHGAPGTGKTFLANALAEECDCPIFVRLPSHCFAATGRGLLFLTTRHHEPSVNPLAPIATPHSLTST